MPGARIKNGFHWRDFNRLQRKLADESGFMFDIHFKVVGRGKRFRLVQNLEKPARREPVAGVIGEPRLPPAENIVVQCAAAIHEFFCQCAPPR